RLSFTSSGLSLTSLMSSKTGSRQRLILSVKNNVPLAVPRLFKDQDPFGDSSLGVTPARRSLFRSRQPNRQRQRHGHDRRLEMQIMPTDLLRRQTFRLNRPCPRSWTPENRAGLKMGRPNLYEK